MQKGYILGATLALVVLLGAGCNQASAPAANNKVEAEKKAPVVEQQVLEGTAVAGSPVEVKVLGLSADKLSAQFEAKVSGAKNIKEVTIYYRCVNAAGEDTTEVNKYWDNDQNPIVPGQTYQGTLDLRDVSEKCAEIKVKEVVFADNTKWTAAE